MSDLLHQLADKLRLWREKPQVMVRELFKTTPDPWQDEVLEQFPHRQRQAMTACKGPGKTAVLAWLNWNFLLTRPHPKMAATSISGDNLRDNLWAEMAKWMKRAPMLEHLFAWNSERIHSLEHPQTWFLSARTWPRTADANQQANTLAGLHADYLMFTLDESGGIPDAVMVTADAGLASCVEGHIVQAGNPTHLEGPLYRANTAERHLWHLINISGDPDDPNRASRVSIEWARQQIQKHGRENPWVLVNVFGRFPPSSLNTLLGPDDVSAAIKRHYREDAYTFAARILGVDVAREGDDQSVIFPRQGLVASKPWALRNADSIQGAGTVAYHWREWDADACFVDNTGGFGGGWIDQLRVLGRDPIPVHFAGEPIDRRYYNKRSEMYFLLAQWIKQDGGALPDLPELAGELTTPTYWFKGDRLILEDKDQIKARIGRSPDYADALALTFAHPVVAKPRGLEKLREKLKGNQRPDWDYDPHARQP